jgi:energy-coupling factor transporter ATP-binding protein EcfA2
MYKYWGFGLNITSAIAMPELLPAEFENADITINIGHVPESLYSEKIIKRPFSLITAQECILSVKGLCRYYAGFGKTIVAEPNTEADEHSVRLFILGSVMAAILYQRGQIPLHASAIMRNGKLTLFCGNSGAGKSTLLAHLSTKGFTVFTDDICVMNLHQPEGLVYGTASYPMIKLWDGTLNELDNEAFNRDFKIRPHVLKYGHFFHDSFSTRALPVDKIFILQKNDDAATMSYNRISQLQAFKLVEKQAYRYRFVTGELLRASHFALIAALIKHAPVIQTSRPPSGTSISEFSDMVEVLLNE